MYPYVLTVHGAWRWVVLALGAYVVVTAAHGLLTPSPWRRRMSRLFGIAVDVQVLLGAALYLTLSPLTTEAGAAAGSSQPHSDLSFIGGSHALIMLGALLAVHVAAVLVRRARTDSARHLRALLFYGLTWALIVIGTPWWRPLMRH